MLDSSFIGQERWQRYFQDAILQGRLARTYGFFGPAHIGKSTFVQSFGRSVLCLAPRPEAAACGQCAACRAWVNDCHPDYITLDGDNDQRLGVAEVRDFIVQLSRTPQQAKQRFAEIRTVAGVTLPSYNALLKTLEEPPAHAVIAVIATDEASLPPTVLSRTQRCYFAPVSSLVLSRALRAEGVAHDVAAELASLSAGRPGLARRWLTEPAALAAYRDEARSFMNLLAGSVTDRLVFTETLATEERCSSARIEEIVEHWHLILRDAYLAVTNVPELMSHQAMRDKFGQFARRFSADHWLRVADALLVARRHLREYANRRLALNNFFISI